MKKVEFKPTNYPSDLTDKEWKIIEPFFPADNKSLLYTRSLVDTVFYLVDNGCKRRALPHDYPPHDMVWSFYRRARESGLWEKTLTVVVKKTRENADRNPMPNYGLIDSQSAKTLCASDERGFDEGKNEREKAAYGLGSDRKGSFLPGRLSVHTDTMGNLLSVAVHAANIHDTVFGLVSAMQAFEKYPTIKKFCADMGYRGTFVEEALERLGLFVDISEKSKPHEWEKLLWRWVVERTLGWLGHPRRLSKDYEISTDSPETMVRISHLKSPLRRLG